MEQRLCKIDWYENRLCEYKGGTLQASEAAGPPMAHGGARSQRGL